MLRLRAIVDRGLEGAVFVLFAVMVGNVLWQIATRFLLRSPSPYTEELARFLLIWTGLLGACVAWRRRQHLAIRFFGEDGESVPAWMRRVGQAAGLAFATLVLGAGGARLVWLTFELEQRSAALGWPLGWVYLAVPVSGLLILFDLVVDVMARERS